MIPVLFAIFLALSLVNLERLQNMASRDYIVTLKFLIKRIPVVLI